MKTTKQNKQIASALDRHIKEKYVNEFIWWVQHKKIIIGLVAEILYKKDDVKIKKLWNILKKFENQGCL